VTKQICCLLMSAVEFQGLNPLSFSTEGVIALLLVHQGIAWGSKHILLRYMLL
jgi:hypothetical protein